LQRQRLADAPLTLLFSYENTITEAANMRSFKEVRRDERFLSLAQFDKFYDELIEICL